METTNTTQTTIDAPKVGEWLVPDGWGKAGNPLLAGDGPCSGGYPGCQFRIVGPNTGQSCPVNVKIAGRREYYRPGSITVRVSVEFVQDGNEPSTITGGWLYRTPYGR
jgi:hypothetical protein